MFALAQTGTPVIRNDYPPVLNRLEAEIRSTAEVVLHAWKYLLARDAMIPEGALAGDRLKWKESASNEWKSFPSWVHGSTTVRQVPVLTGATAESLQQMIADDVKPLVGMRYLHRAKAEADPRYRWVDATIAAELSIKEILQMARPETEVLFKHFPSPPLSKLYGEILDAYLGERSPYLKALSSGAEKRNALIHRPIATDIDAVTAQEYVGNVEAAIFHALALLFKGKCYFDLWENLYCGPR